MQVPRYWRMKQQQYQLTGSRNQDGSASVIQRPIRATTVEEDNQVQETVAVEAA